MSGLTDAALAADIAEAAGQVLLAVREELLDSGAEDQRAIAKAGDQRAQDFIAERLAAERPQDAVLSEEAKDDLSRLDAARVWIIDPLDGTKEFSQGRHDWAVHVALWEDGELAAGAVALPGIGQTLRSDDPPAVPAREDDSAPLRFAISRSHPSELITAVIEESGGGSVAMGSAGFKVCAVVRGEADAYVHAGGQFEWDSAAPIAVARAAGLFASRLDGSPMRYNQRDVYLPDLIVCRPADADRVRAAVDAATARA
ncbi:3'(2'),5'-bisphosphate nucleotidase CysQ [Ornithinimicrobium faecis]|uniref:3'(2'),5-bisphosphonucleoside 3'(2')-phosphohydrolase n=1 Tax=Ornithinimicrobium faecis TaxID=2934158 RepID=A0ABY4YTT0_9MICO|nr:3'(2'),5'-bisphosphate nucleotidase CysQ [Ornithinimicrobium sp. HY1793]USQ79875.1 3'(2'),5'-bisphosphate nucleotidase CysQ [Ornithinimicrobium sp. HY1793]